MMPNRAKIKRLSNFGVSAQEIKVEIDLLPHLIWKFRFRCSLQNLAENKVKLSQFKMGILFSRTNDATRVMAKKLG